MKTTITIVLAAMVLAGCATTPTGPDVMVLPGTGKTFDEFRADDLTCRDYAFQQIGGKAVEQSAQEKLIGNAALGTAIGAVAGAAIGGRSGAGVGAGMGLIVGSANSAQSGHAAGYGSQRRYDIAYVQCMYAKGHRVPVGGSYTLGGSNVVPVSLPPPPAGSPPPPPSR